MFQEKTVLCFFPAGINKVEGHVLQLDTLPQSLHESFSVEEISMERRQFWEWICLRTLSS